MHVYESLFKRPLDIVVSIAMLPLVGLACAIAAPLIKADGGPVMFLSQRRGRYGRPFTIYKLRTMGVDAPDLRNADGSTLTSDSDPRVTRVGRFLRKASVDELPQVLNVLKGDMSLVGPRPNMAKTPLNELSAVQLKRIKVRPGITGYSQAFFRNSIPAAEREALDAQYVDDITFAGDLRIIAATFGTVLTSRGVNAAAGSDDALGGRR